MTQPTLQEQVLQQRNVNEYDRAGLEHTINHDPAFQQLSVRERVRLRRQEGIMRALTAVLDDRIVNNFC